MHVTTIWLHRRTVSTLAIQLLGSAACSTTAPSAAASVATDAMSVALEVSQPVLPDGEAGNPAHQDASVDADTVNETDAEVEQAAETADTASPVGQDAEPADGDADLAKVDANGAMAKCLVGNVATNEGNEVIPQSVLQLKGFDACAASGGAGKKFLWSVKQPAGSQQAFVPGPNFPNPVFLVNAAGAYSICLAVWDQTGQPCCQSSCVDIFVIPDAALHIEILWDGPASTDMDLHFAHELASGSDLDCDGDGDPWFHIPYDAFWFNPNPNWGTSNPAANDDPSLDLDDTDGDGPENLNVPAPEGTLADVADYHVGVHVMSAKGGGPTKATLVVYVFGVLAVQIAKVALNAWDMWYVGKVHWPNAITDKAAANVEPFELCYQDADPCKGGKRWLAKGDWCIANCYTNPAFPLTPLMQKPTACP